MPCNDSLSAGRPPALPGLCTAMHCAPPFLCWPRSAPSHAHMPPEIDATCWPYPTRPRPARSDHAWLGMARHGMRAFAPCFRACTFSPFHSSPLPRIACGLQLTDRRHSWHSSVRPSFVLAGNDSFVDPLPQSICMLVALLVGERSVDARVQTMWDAAGVVFMPRECVCICKCACESACLSCAPPSPLPSLSVRYGTIAFTHSSCQCHHPAAYPPDTTPLPRASALLQ